MAYLDLARASAERKTTEMGANALAIGRMSEARDITAAALICAPNEAAFITGFDFPVEGGGTA